MTREFNPDLTPSEMEALGVLAKQYYGKDPKSHNFFKIDASMDKWPEGWVDQQTAPLGWFEWYKGYANGVRTHDDDRQIARWISFKARHLAQLKKADPTLTDLNIQPKRRQALLNWGIAPGGKNVYLEKIADTFTHATSAESLEKILNSGKIKSVAQIAGDNPDTKVDVEHKDGSADRAELKASDAHDKMDGEKEPDKIFLTRDGYLPAYGDHVILKELEHPEEVEDSEHPNEHTTRRALSVKHNAVIYVPKSKLEEWRKKYPDINFMAKDEIPVKALESGHSEEKPLMKKVAMLLQQYQHDETGRKLWHKEKTPKPGRGWSKTKFSKYVKAKKSLGPKPFAKAKPMVTKKAN